MEIRKSANFLNLTFLFIASVLFLVLGVQPILGGEKWGKVDWEDPFELPEEIPHQFCNYLKKL